MSIPILNPFTFLPIWSSWRNPCKSLYPDLLRRIPAHYLLFMSEMSHRFLFESSPLAVLFGEAMEPTGLDQVGRRVTSIELVVGTCNCSMCSWFLAAPHSTPASLSPYPFCHVLSANVNQTKSFVQEDILSDILVTGRWMWLIHVSFKVSTSPSVLQSLTSLLTIAVKNNHHRWHIPKVSFFNKTISNFNLLLFHISLLGGLVMGYTHMQPCLLLFSFATFSCVMWVVYMCVDAYICVCMCTWFTHAWMHICVYVCKYVHGLHVCRCIHVCMSMYAFTWMLETDIWNPLPSLSHLIYGGRVSWWDLQLADG